MIELQWAGESFIALADKALWWPRLCTLCVADLHLGKAAAFRRSGIPVPEDTTRSIVDRLDRMLHRLRPRRLVILGDLLHARDGRDPQLLDSFATWRGTHAELDVLLVRGNHDLRAGDPPAAWNMRIESEPFADPDDGQVAFAHHPEVAALAARPVLCGHVHPAIMMCGTMRDLRAPCFWFSDRTGMLPAFGAFTGCRVVLPGPRDQVFAVGPNDIVDVTAQIGPRAASR